jgi:hypothetical protein
MYVLKSRIKGEITGLNLRLDALEPLLDSSAVSGIENADGHQHLSMSAGAGDVLGIETLVERDRRVYASHDVG